MKKFFSLVLALVMALSLTTVAWGADVAEYNGTNYGTLQEAVDAAEATGGTITLLADCGEDVVVEQAPNVAIVIDGANKTYTGTITVDGKSAAYPTAALKIQNVNFDATSITKDACINMGGTNAMRYISNLTVTGCTFSYSGSGDVVAVKSYTGGDKNLTIEGCTVNSGMHSLLQVKNVETGVKIIGCKVYSKEGVNLNSTPALEMSGCEFDVQGYAVRVGVNGSVNTDEKSFTITDSTLKSACADGDAVIVFRDDAKKADVTITDTTLTGTTTFAGNDDVTDIFVDGAMVDGVAEVNGTQYKSLQAAIAAAAGGTVKLLDDVTLTGSINVTDALTIDGNNKTITMDFANGKAFFNASGMNEGVADSLTVKNLKMVMTGATKQGYAVVAKKADSAFAISFTDCHFENMYCAVMLNGCGGTVAPTVTITDSSFKDVNYGLSFAEEAYAGDVSFENNTMTGEISIQETFPAGSGYLTAPTVEISSGSFSNDVSEYLAPGYVYLNGTVKKTTSVGNTTVIDAKTLSVVDALGAEVDVSGITSIVKVAATTNKTTVDGKTTTTVVPAWYQLSDGTNSATFVECDKTSADYMFTFKGVGSVYVREMPVPAAFDATPVTLYTAPLKATCDYVGQDNDVYVVAKDKYYAVDPTVKPGAEKYALLSNGNMVVFYGEATAKDHNWAQATKETYNTKTGDITSVKCPDCKNPVAVYKTAGVFDGKVYKQITVGVAKNYYYVAGTAANTITGTIVGVPSVPSTDKVQSAETFDAGIAMYVGMSVMAAAGSAVVLKKKD